MKKYNVIYADPPWPYDNKKTGWQMKHGINEKYKTMTIEEIKQIPLNNIIQTDCICFMWVTVPLLDQGIETLKAWGFTYKTMVTWDKDGALGLGHWFRVQTEHLIIGLKGKVTPFRCQDRNLYRKKKCGHSKKPHFFRELISTLVIKSFENPVKLELFARTREGMFGNYEYEGWDVFGNQVENSIKL